MNALLLAALLSRPGLLPGLLLAQAGPPPAATQTQQSLPAETPPFQPQVSDPLLEPVPPAKQEVSSWAEALALLQQRSTNLRTALAQVEAAAGQRRIALAALLPTLVGNASVQYNVLYPDATTVLGGGGGALPSTAGSSAIQPTSPLGVGTLSAAVPLFDLNAVYTFNAAKESLRTANLSLAETRRQLSLALAQALVGATSEERLAEVTRVNLRTALERQALAQRRFDLGAGTRLDVVRTEQDSETARAAVVQADESLRQSRETLGLVLGTPEAVGVRRGVTLETLLAEGRGTCRELEDLASRPDLAAARSRVKVAEKQVSGVKAQYAPTLEFQSTAVALTVKDGFAEVPAWNIGAALVLPFWDGGVREGLLRQTRAQAEVARQGAVDLERTASVQLTQARRATLVARKARDIAQRERDLAEENDRLTRRSFEVGTGTSLELVDSAGALRQAELTLVVRQFQLQQAEVNAFLSEAACDW